MVYFLGEENNMSYSELAHNIKQRMCWDKVRILLTPRSRAFQEGYRINISLTKEKEIQEAKEILKKAQVVFEDRKATSFSDTVRPGDRTLRVIHQKSVQNLRKMWAEEFEKSPLGQALKKQRERK